MKLTDRDCAPTADLQEPSTIPIGNWHWFWKGEGGNAVEERAMRFGEEILSSAGAGYLGRGRDMGRGRGRGEAQGRGARAIMITPSPFRDGWDWLSH